MDSAYDWDLHLFRGFAECQHRGVSPSIFLAEKCLKLARTTYVVDCYQHLAGELGLLVNMGRQLLSFYVAFYIIYYLERVGFAWAYGIFAILSVILAVPVMLLIPYGERIRMKMGVPHPELVQNIAI